MLTLLAPDRPRLPPVTDLPIEQLGPVHWRHVARLMDEGFGLAGDERLADDGPTSPLAEVMATSGLTTYAAFADWTIVGVGGLLLRGRTGLLTGAVTALGSRSRGVHAGLLQRRVEDARRWGAERVVAQAPEGSEAAARLQRLGFVPLEGSADDLPRCVGSSS